MSRGDGAQRYNPPSSAQYLASYSRKIQGRAGEKAGLQLLLRMTGSRDHEGGEGPEAGVHY